MIPTCDFLRPLTPEEKSFVKEAEAGYFLVGYGDDGAPYAHGAHSTDNLFSMEVESFREPHPDWDGATCYFLPSNESLTKLLKPYHD